MFRISFSKGTVKRLKQELNEAYVRGDLRAVRRLSVLVMIRRTDGLGGHSGSLECFSTDRVHLAE
jgi:hypothetical protein